jgi:branched-chain amino acid transport system permease protein
MNVAIFAPLQSKGSELLPLIATIGVSVTMENAMLAWFGPIPYSFDSPYSNDVIRFGGTFITVQNSLIIAVSAMTIGLLYAFLKLTFLGKALRAVSQDRETAGLMGINPDLVVMLTFVIASALAGMAGACSVPPFPSARPQRMIPKTNPKREKYHEKHSAAWTVRAGSVGPGCDRTAGRRQSFRST